MTIFDGLKIRAFRRTRTVTWVALSNYWICTTSSYFFVSTASALWRRLVWGSFQFFMSTHECRTVCGPIIGTNVTEILRRGTGISVEPSRRRWLRAVFPDLCRLSLPQSGQTKKTITQVWLRRPWASMIVTNTSYCNQTLRSVRHSWPFPSKFVPRRRKMRSLRCRLSTPSQSVMCLKVHPPHPLTFLLLLYSYEFVWLLFLPLPASLHAARRYWKVQGWISVVPMLDLILAQYGLRTFIFEP